MSPAERAVQLNKPCVVLIETEKADGAGFGTGFIVSSDGYVVTNEHVVKDAQRVTVYYQNKTRLSAKIIKKNRQDDLALLKVESADALPTVSLGDDVVEHGVPVAVTGYPLPPMLLREGLNLDSSSISGISSGMRTTDGSSAIPRVAMQMDAAISQGNSGSPVYKRSTGEVVGVAVAGIGGTAIHFAVPISRVKGLLVDAGVQLTANVPEEPILFPAGDLDDLNLVAGNKTLHRLFGQQKTLDIDYRSTNDRLFSRSHFIYQAAVGSPPNLSTPLVSAGNKIYFGALDGTLYQYDTAYQELDPVAQADHPFYFSPTTNGQKIVIASGFLIPDKELSAGAMVANLLLAPMFTVDIHVVKGFGNLLAINPSSGSVDWVVETRFLAEPSLAGNKVFAGSLDALSAYSLADGKELWKTDEGGKGGDTYWFSPANSDGATLGCLVVPVRVKGTDELLGRSSSFVAAYDGETGKRKWKKELNDMDNWERPMSGSAYTDKSKDRMFVVHCDKINAYQLSSGKELWSKPFSTRQDPGTNDKDKLGPYFTPGLSLSGDTLYVGCEDKKLYAIAASTGQELWSRPTNGRVGIPTPYGGSVYVGSSDKHLYSMNAATGALQWKYYCGGSISGRPVVAGKRVYCSSDNGRFHTVRIPK